MPRTLPKDKRDKLQIVHDNFVKCQIGLASKSKHIKDEGYRLFCGPPLRDAPLLISECPGITADEAEKYGVESKPTSWPKELSYVDRVTYFAQELGRIFDGGGMELENINASYSLMFRAKSRGVWTRNVNNAARKEAALLSQQTLERMIEYLEPKLIYAVGAKAFSALKCHDQRTSEGFGKTDAGDEVKVVKWGSYKGTDVINTYHPSAHYNTGCREVMSRELSKFWREHGIKTKKLEKNRGQALASNGASKRQQFQVDEVTDAFLQSIIRVAINKEKNTGVQAGTYLEGFAAELRKHGKTIEGN